MKIREWLKNFEEYIVIDKTWLATIIEDWDYSSTYTIYFSTKEIEQIKELLIENIKELTSKNFIKEFFKYQDITKEKRNKEILKELMRKYKIDLQFDWIVLYLNENLKNIKISSWFKNSNGNIPRYSTINFNEIFQSLKEK